MKILIEGEIYNVSDLENIFDDPKFYKQNGLEGRITSVGYYHSFSSNEIVYMLPKVFMRDSEVTVFNNISKDELLNFEQTESFKHKSDFNWIRQLSVYFYNSLIEYRSRNTRSTSVQYSQSFVLNTNLGEKEYSYVDLLLSFVNFYKKNKKNILYRHIEHKSNQIRKPKWEKTIRKSIPILTSNNEPIYLTYRNKKKIIDREEELLIYFFSILNHFNEQHNLFIKIDKSYEIIKGESFKKLESNGLIKLRKIKYRYFNDSLRRMYDLCEIFFSLTNSSGVKKKNEDFISISNYNLVFEDMVDKLFSDEIGEEEINGTSLKSLKYNDDGKIIDHIYSDRSLIDTSNIFFIGDSKYYKSGKVAEKLSKYKQFTYAKNVIQFNIDLLNEKKNYKKSRYRDELTDGYNLTPNFFIYGYIKNHKDFDSNLVRKRGETEKSFHFENRLFDRDTLFVHQYDINFLYVLKAYSQFSENKIASFRYNVRIDFRNNFIEFFNDSVSSGFKLYERQFSSELIESFIDENFRLLNGKCYSTVNHKLIVAVHNNDISLNDLISNFIELSLN